MDARVKPAHDGGGIRMPEPHYIPHLFFGLDPMVVSTFILAVTYAIIMSEKVNRAIVALLGAGVMILVGVLDQDEALKGIDWNTIGLLTGMMILVSISRRSGMFQYLAIWSAQKAQGASRRHPVAAADHHRGASRRFLDNVTTVLLIVPVTLAITKELEVPAYPYPVRRDLRLQHRRHRDADRRSAQHPDRLAGRPRLQRLRHPPHAGHRRGHGGAGADDPPPLGHGARSVDAGAQGPRHGHDARARRSSTGCCSSSRSWCSRS